MASYSVVLKPSAVKELEAIPAKDRRRVAQRIQRLAEKPRPSGAERLSGLERYRLRPGHRRIVYSVEDDRLVVLVVKVGHRRDIQRRQRHLTSGGAPT